MIHPALPLLEQLGTGKIRQVRHLRAQESVTTPWPSWVPAPLQAAYAALGVAKPWAHQIRAADALFAGRVVALSTGTGSGKSLAGWLPVLAKVMGASALCSTPNPLSAPPAVTTSSPGAGAASRYRSQATATAIYLAPTKALAADQVAGLEALLRAGELAVSVAAADGDADSNEKEWARRHANIIATNPDFAHYVIAPSHERWQRLFRGLELIFVDEAHAYRGVSGAHIALLLRRLLRLARHYGAEPAVLVASATGSDPVSLAATLTGVDRGDVVEVSGDEAPRGQRSVLIWEPPHLDDEPFSPRRSVISEAAGLFTELIAAGQRTLVFARSRNAVELIADIAQSHLPMRGVDPDVVAAYRGGYLPEERRGLERRLRSGELLGLATTNALELGIDIASLDAVVVAGWPGSRASFWQQAGRAGRAGRPGLAVMVVGEDPLEQYLADHPNELDRIEPVVVEPQNPYIVGPHLCSAAAELPLQESDLALFGSTAPDLVAELAARKGLRKRGNFWYWDQGQEQRPHDLVQFRGGAAADVMVVEETTGRMVGTVSKDRADATVFPGAIYVHQGQSFEILKYDSTVALARAGNFPYVTCSREAKHVQIRQVLRSEVHGAVTWNYGVVETFTKVTGFERLALPGREIMGHFPLTLPTHSFSTMAVWWHAAVEELPVAAGELPGALHAVEHCAIGVMGLVAPCDRSDIGGLSTAHHPDTGEPTVFVYDGVPGGAGFAQSAFDNRARWLAHTEATLAGCECEYGCPRCVFSPKCGNGNEPLSKEGAWDLAELLAAGLNPQ